MVRYKLPHFCPICNRGPIYNLGGYVRHVTVCEAKNRHAGIVVKEAAAEAAWEDQQQRETGADRCPPRE